MDDAGRTVIGENAALAELFLLLIRSSKSLQKAYGKLDPTRDRADRD